MPSNFPPPSSFSSYKHYYNFTTEKISLWIFVFFSQIIPILILGTFIYLSFSPFSLIFVFAYCLVRNIAESGICYGFIFMFLILKIVHFDAYFDGSELFFLIFSFLVYVFISVIMLYICIMVGGKDGVLMLSELKYVYFDVYVEGSKLFYFFFASWIFYFSLLVC